MIARNLRTPFGEIDLIAKHQKTLVFIEIKTRTSVDFGLPEESVTESKRARLGRLASWYLARESDDRDLPTRFDVLAIQLKNGEPIIKLIQNAFEVSC